MRTARRGQVRGVDPGRPAPARRSARPAREAREAGRARQRALTAQPETGFTLVELLVVVPVLLIITALVMSTLVTAYGAESGVQATAQASSQVTLAFMQLDSEVRYAAEVDLLGAYSNNYYVEFQSNWTQSTQGQSQCTQLEYSNSNGELQQRSWLLNATPPSGWQLLASGLKTSISTDPFSVSAPPGSPWQLSVAITSVVGTGASAGTAQSSFTLTSLDATSNSQSGQSVCDGEGTP